MAKRDRVGSRWSIRAKITAMVAVPLVMLVAFWLFSVALTVPSALDLRGAGTTNDKVTVPGEALIAALRQERLATVQYAAGHAVRGGGELFRGRRVVYGAGVADALDLDEGVPLVLCDARQRESSKAVPIQLVQHVLSLTAPAGEVLA
jgi:hypothetical protein